MRIHVTGLRGLPGVMGGIESHCEELLPRVKARRPDYDISVLCRAPYMSETAAEYRGLTLTSLPSPTSKHLEAIVATFIAILHSFTNRAKVVHIHAIGPALLAPFARLLGLYVVVTHHGRDYERMKWGRFAKLALKLGEKAALIWAHRVIAVSPSLATSLRQVFPTQAYKVTYIPNGAPRLPSGAASQAQVLERFGLAPRGFVLAVGRLVPEKGFHDLVSAFAQGTQGGRKLVIVGDADHDSHYARTLRAAASDNVLFLGRQPRDVIKVLYESCDLFAVPSYHEGLPIVALEAGSLGARMVLSAIPANRDVGLAPRHYFEAGDVAALAAMLEGPADQFVVDARDVLRRFDWDAVAGQTIQVYEQLATVEKPLAGHSQESFG